MTHEELTENLKALGLSTMATEYVQAAKIAEKKRSTYEQYLGILANLELQAKLELVGKGCSKRPSSPGPSALKPTNGGTERA